jgi:hypothetical protein
MKGQMLFDASKYVIIATVEMLALSMNIEGKPNRD